MEKRRRTSHTPDIIINNNTRAYKSPKVRQRQTKTILDHGRTARGPPQPQVPQHPLSVPFGHNATLVSTRGALDSKDNHYTQIARRKLAITLDEVLRMVLYQRRTIMDAKKKKRSHASSLSSFLAPAPVLPTRAGPDPDRLWALLALGAQSRTLKSQNSSCASPY